MMENSLVTKQSETDDGLFILTTKLNQLVLRLFFFKHLSYISMLERFRVMLTANVRFKLRISHNRE